MSRTTPSSTATTPRTSIELAKSAFKQPIVSITPLESSLSSSTHTTTPKSKSLWQFVKRHVKEHHDSVNAVYTNYYGQGYKRDVRKKSRGSEWAYERGVYGRS